MLCSLHSSLQDVTEGLLHQFLSGDVKYSSISPAGCWGGSFLLGSLLFLQAVKSQRWPGTKSEGQEEKPRKGTVSMAGWHMGGGQRQKRALEKDK